MKDNLNKNDIIREINNTIAEKLIKAAVADVVENETNEIQKEFSNADDIDFDADRLKRRIDKELRKTNYISKRNIKKVCLLVAILMILLVGLCMNATALKAYFYKVFAGERGNVATVNILKESDMMYNGKSVGQVYDNLKKENPDILLIVPNWLPKGTVLKDINKDLLDRICLHYSCENNVEILLRYAKITEGINQVNELQLDGNKYEISDIEVMGEKGIVYEIIYENNERSYYVYWAMGNTAYRLAIHNGTRTELSSIISGLEII